MPSATSSNTPAGGTAKPRMSSRHSSQGPVPLATPTSPATATTTAMTTDTLKVVQPPTPASPTFASPPTSPTATSKLPRFLQSPAQRDRSKSLSVDRPSSAASSSASHGTTASYTTNTSNSTSTSSASGRRSATRFLGLGKDKERERERQRIREAERGAPSAAELLTLHESQQTSPTSYDFAPSSPPSAYGTARPRTRSERHFSASTPPPSSNSSSSGHGQQPDLTLARTPSRLGADGPLATRLSGWFAHLAGSTSDLSIAATISGSLTHGVSTAAALASSTSSNAANKKSKAKSDDSHNSNAKSTSKANESATTKGGAASGKTSLLDKAVRYLLDGDASPDRSAEEIWLMGVRLPGWGREDEERVAAAAAEKAGSKSSNGSAHGHSHGGHHHVHNPLATSKRRSGSKSRDVDLSSSHAAPPSTSTSNDGAGDLGADTLDGADVAGPPDAGPWPAAFHAAFYAQVWCTYRAGFEPIRDLPSLSSLPPPLFFPNATPSSPSDSRDALAQSTGHGSSGTGSSGTVVPHTHTHGQTPTSPRMQHSPSQSDSSYSSTTSSSRGESGNGGGGGTSRHGHGHGSAHGSGHSQASSGYSNASYSSYASYNSSGTPSSTSTSTSNKKKWWPLPSIGGMGMGGTKGWTSDSGWGCMLRTSQSLLATALGRVGEPPLLPTPTPPFPPPSRPAHALHARLLSWFLDAPAAPFGVHRMALAGKAAGKDVGMWFGPSAAAGALRTLVEAFPAAGLGVSVATDGTLYQTEVFAASHSPIAASSESSSASVSSHGSHGRGSSSGHSKGGKDAREKMWGDRPVLLLLGIRLGLDGVNPIYYETIKLLYTFPQSVGIAGGRPSSSYYFVGVQGDGLFYLDPHHSRPAVPLRPFVGEQPSVHRPLSSQGHGHSPSYLHASSSHAHERRSLSPEAAYARGGSTSPESAHGHSFARGGSLSPELVYHRGGSMSPDFAQGRGQTPMTEDELVVVRPHLRDASSSTSQDGSSSRHGHDGQEGAGVARGAPAGGLMTPAEEAYYARAYSAAEMRTFHCERVRKMPLSGLDPSMLIGFVCRDEAEWIDLRRRIKALPRTIFAIQDEPPTWPGADDDDDMGLESVSDPEEIEDAGGDDGDMSSASHAPSNASHGDAVSSASHVAASSFSHTHAHHNSNSTTHSASTTSSGKTRSEVDTEEDPVAPITPLPGARFDLSGGPPPAPAGKEKGTVGDAYAELEGDDGFVDASGDMDIEDDWVDPVAPPPAPVAKKVSKKGKGKSKKAVPVPSVHYPFPVSVEDSAGVPASPPQRERIVMVSPRAGGAGVGGQRMHTARARDGGRTQSGGVRGVLTED